MCHRAGSLRCWSTNTNRASESGCSPVSPRLQGILGASPRGWRSCPLSYGQVPLSRTCVTSGGVTEEVNRQCSVREDWRPISSSSEDSKTAGIEYLIHIKSPWKIYIPDQINSGHTSLNSFWKEYNLQASIPFCNVRTVNLLTYINVNKLLSCILFTSSISFLHSCDAGLGISCFSGGEESQLFVRKHLESYVKIQWNSWF